MHALRLSHLGTGPALISTGGAHSEGPHHVTRTDCQNHMCLPPCKATTSLRPCSRSRDAAHSAPGSQQSLIPTKKIAHCT